MKRTIIKVAILALLGTVAVSCQKEADTLPSAAEVEEEGLSVGEMNKILVQKVEELTLHIIDLQKQVDELKNLQQ